jgi:molybdopterin converting factor small subunit
VTRVRIPPVLRVHVGDHKEVDASGATVGEVLKDLVGRHPGLGEQLFNADGALHRFVNVYLNGRDVRYLDALDTAVGERDAIIILPAMAGGA